MELFQGREKDVIIMSTVRSKVLAIGDQLHLGSLSNPKRLNVAITRAKSHMFIIGDADVLKHDKNWHFILKTCKVQGCITGKEFIDDNQQKYCGINKSEKIMSASSLLSYVKKSSSGNLVNSFSSMSLGKITQRVSQPNLPRISRLI